MKVLTRKNDIMINNRKMRVGELITNLKSLPSTEVRDFFIKQKKMVPRKVRCDVLRVIIDQQLSDKKVKASLTDEMNYRLNWYGKFSEYQLENLLAYFNNPALTDLFKEELWLAIVSRHDDLKIDDITIFTLYQKSINFRIESETNENLMDYNRTLDCIFFDEEGALDGLSYNDFRENLLQSSTLVELREIGTKYGIDVPRRIKKNELMEIIIDELKAQGKFNAELEEKIRKMSVVGLQRLAKDNGIKASIELKKEDIIEYIIKYLNANEMPEKEKIADVVEETTTEEVVEDTPEDVTPEVVEEEEVIEDEMDEVDFSNIDLADLFAPEEEEVVNKDPDVIVPDAAPRDFDDAGFDDMFGDIDMGIDDGMLEPAMAEETQTVDTTADEGQDAMEGIDFADLDIFIPSEEDASDSVFQFDEMPATPQAQPTNNSAFESSLSTGTAEEQSQMSGFKSELNEFNRKLESLLAFQMKMLEKNNQQQASGEKKSDSSKAGSDLFSTVQAEVKEEKIKQSSGLEELRKLAEANGGVMPGVRGGSIVQGSYLNVPERKEDPKEAKRRAKERERAKKFMSPEELEFLKEQEAREKEQLRRLRDAEKAKKENARSSNGMGGFKKFLLAMLIIIIVVFILLAVTYGLVKGQVITEGPLVEIYNFFRDLRDMLFKK